MPRLPRQTFSALLKCLVAIAPIASVAAFASGALLGGCTPEIGDRCVLSTDCSTRGDRLCDTSQPQGYCTQFNCAKNSCPNDGACLLFNASVPGCGYDDRAGNYGSRVARSFCVATCDTNEDCRSGYVCTDPRLAPWSALIQDDNQGKRTCMVATIPLDGGADASTVIVSSAPPGGPLVCRAVAPDVATIEAGAASIGEAGVMPPLVSPDAGAGDAGGGDAGDSGDGG